LQVFFLLHYAMRNTNNDGSTSDGILDKIFR